MAFAGKICESSGNSCGQFIPPRLLMRQSRPVKDYLSWLDITSRHNSTRFYVSLSYNAQAERFAPAAVTEKER